MVYNENIIRDQTFIHKHEPSTTDEQTVEALKLLEAENEIFTVPDLPPTTFLPRFDLEAFEEEDKIPEMVAKCQAKPDQVHALSPTYENYEYVWKPVYVLDYVNKRWKVKDQSTGQIKFVTRLSILFLDEDPQAFLKRVKECKMLQKNVNDELMFTSLVDSISPDNVSILSKQRRFNLLKKSMREKTDIGREKIAETFKHLLRVVEEEYIRQMKKCIILREMQNVNTHDRFKNLKIPIRLPTKAAPYLAVVPIPKFDYNGSFHKFSANHWNKDPNQVKVTEKLVIRSLRTLDQKFMNTNKAVLKLPKELKDLVGAQNAHYAAVQQNLGVQWRDYFVGEIQDDLKTNHNFYEASMENYKESELKRIVTRFELLLHTYLREFVKNSIDDWVDFIRSFTKPVYDRGDIWKISNDQMIIVHLSIHNSKKKKKDDKNKKKDKAEKEEVDDIPDNSIVLKPSLEECADFLRGAFNKMIKATNNVKFLESELMPFLKDAHQGDESDEEEEKKEKTEEEKKLEDEETPIDAETGERLGPRRGPNFKLDADFPWIREGIAEVDRMINENVDAPTQLLNKYKEFEDILKTSKRDKVNSLFEPKVPITEIREALDYYDQRYADILNCSNNFVDFPIFKVEAKHLKEKLAEQADKIKSAILDATHDWCVKTVTEVLEEYKFMKEKIGTDPKDEAILVEIREFIKDSPNKVANLELKVASVGKHMLLLEDFSRKYDEKEFGKYWSCKMWPLEISSEITLGAIQIEKQEEAFMYKLDNEKEEFKKQLKVRQETLEKIKKFKNLEDSKNFAADCDLLEKTLMADAEKVQKFNEREGLFNLDRSEYPELDTIHEEFQPYNKLIPMAYEISWKIKDWMTQQFDKLPPFQEIETTIISNRSLCGTIAKKLEEDNPDVAEAAQELRGHIDDFRKHLPLIKAMSSEAIMDDDWNTIRVIIGQEALEREDLKLEDMIRDDFAKHLTEIEEVVMKAEKKLSLRNRLKQLRDEIKEVEIELFDHKSGTHILKGYVDIFTVLDDQMVATQTMLGSQFMDPPLRKEGRLWEAKLRELSEIIDEMRKCQKAWMYLEPIFSSDDIHKQLPTEGPMFQAVDAYWRSQMELIHQDPGLLDLLDRESLKTTFQGHNKKLDDIQKSLNDYLEQKRGVFPRFYFLANEDLLLILAQTKDPLAVQAHMEKCFEGIQELIFEDKCMVRGMVSAEGEQVRFNDQINVEEGDNKGNIENWLTDVEKEMRKCLKKICADSCVAYVNTKRTDWVKKWPGQIILAVSQIFWTEGVESALKQGDRSSNAIVEFEDVLNKQIEDIVLLVRGDLEVQTRVTLKALVVIDVHARDVVRDLIKKNVTDADEFEWTAQLRYYMEGKDMLQVKMVNAVLNYGYEYLGNSLRLVITPLTDRCYRTLMGAKHLNYGGAPEGPAGTGKTESVKDLAKAIAVQCVVFNCSDGLDYKAMGKFFKGLASSGAWCCFDEFNRIDLEVLSVIAQQILTIQNAIADPKTKTFAFEGTNVSLNRACAVNITMNPGYAGRSELPDNLKALFRPCAMMIPDYSLIAMIELYSFGFSKANELAVKIVTLLKLSSEQLSSQDHYDFGMRALKAMLTACGNLRRALDYEEDMLALRALYDVNLPKFTSNDIPLFLGITSDLFPSIELPKPDYGNFMVALKEKCEENNLKAKDAYLEKCIQLYETLCVRHGLMLVGKAFSGKSQVIKTLKQAITSLKDKDPMGEVVETYYINPKSITLGQLYGFNDLDTNEWTDGVLALTISSCAASSTTHKKWVVFDGPVDAIWIESMNTVLDDNKKLCLTSGSIIKLKPTMTIMFEVADLAVASPATVSRCGMVFLEPSRLGYDVLIYSYCNTLKLLLETQWEMIFDAFTWFSEFICLYIVDHWNYPSPTDKNVLIDSTLKIFDSLIAEYKLEDAKIPKDIDEMLPNLILFSIVWGIGGPLHESARPGFEKFVLDCIYGENIVEKYKLVDFKGEFQPLKLKINLPQDFTSLFGLFYEKTKLTWLAWSRTISQYIVPQDVPYNSIIVPTEDSIRVAKIMSILVMNDKHALFVGPTGTGKTISIANEIMYGFPSEDWTSISLAFSAQTSAFQTQIIIDEGMEKRRMGIYGPPMGKKGIIFVDDLNMPQKEEYGAQPPIELLRQWMDYNGWYDLESAEKTFKQIQSIKFVAAMAPPGGGRNFITERYSRHFCTVYVSPYSNESLKYIFSNCLESLFMSNKNPQFPKTVTGLKDTLVSATIQTYEKVTSVFKPTPTKSHYTYNLRDVSKVFQGIFFSKPKGIRTDNEMIKLWAHECIRVFHDRLISEEDRAKFMEHLKTIISEKFKREWEKLVTVSPLLFSSFVPTIYPDDDTSKKPMKDIYCELIDREKLVKSCKDALLEFNDEPDTKKMDLVLFMDAIEHVVKIFRIITTPKGNGLLVGVGGSGRKSLASLATYIADFDLFQIEISKDYKIDNWKDDMRNMFNRGGVEERGTVFLFSDTHIVKEAFLEDVNNILNNGEIPNLFSAIEDYTNVSEGMKDAVKGDPKYSNYGDNELFELFKERCRNNIHVMLAFSPIGEDFRRRLRMFPSIVNCTTIDWFLPWPKDALTSVAQHFLEDVDLPNRDGIVSICVDMQQRVRNLTKKYYDELRKYYYVTPTSYLELIKTFKSLLDKKRDEVGTIINKFRRGLDQLQNAQVEVAKLQEELKLLGPQLEQSQKETNELLVDLEKQRKIVAEKTIEVEAEAKECGEKKETAEGIEADCKAELAKVEPILKKAMRAVGDLSPGDIVEIRGIAKPSAGVVLVIKTLCMLFDIKPDKVRGATAKEGVELNYWDPAKKKLLTPKLLKNCMAYDKDKMDPEIVANIKEFTESQEYSEAELKKASKAALGLGNWVKAMVAYDEAMKIVTPKKQKLAEAQAQLKEAKDMYDQALANLEEIREKVRKLEETFTEAEEKKKKLQKERDLCAKKLQRAQDLIEKLAGENESWIHLLAVNEKASEHLVGDVLISSGIIAYLGVFIQSYRNECIKTWKEMLDKFGIKSSDEYSLQSVLGNPVQIRSWQIYKLPTDTFSVDNAIILDNSDRWPLMIDPQMQANIWIKSMEEHNEIKTLKPTSDAKEISRTLDNCLMLGTPIILEDCLETLDPIFEPLLEKQIEGQGNKLTIKLGDGVKEYSPDFRFYLTTKLSSPHYPPEVCVKVVMLNFMVTEDGLEDQMLSVVVKNEDPRKYEMRNQAITQEAENNKTKKELEDKILNQIAGASSNLLEDDELIHTLDESKAKYIQIERQLKEMEANLKSINAVRDHFKPVAKRVARYFFCLSDMSNIDPMYQYSLKWYVMIFQRALESSEPGDKQTRSLNIIKEFTLQLYNNVCQSLFEKDKLLFSYLMCLKVMDERSELNQVENRFMLTGGIQVVPVKPNPASHWLLDKAWCTIEEMSKLIPHFKGFDKEFEENVKTWEKIYNYAQPQNYEEAEWPEKWLEDSIFHKIMILKILRPDKIVAAIQNLVVEEKELGTKFIQPPPFDLKRNYEEARCNTPIILILSPGADPMSELDKLSKHPSIRKRMTSLSLGQGQDQIAIRSFNDAKERGEWVVMQNCHLCPSFMPTLEKLINQIDEDPMNEFRVWLTSMPSNLFPVSILQNGVKVTNEPPKGIKNNMYRSYLGVDEDEFESCEKPAAYKKLLFSLCFFNALILERRKYGSLGWNIPYEFSNSDLKISQSQLLMFLNTYEQVPWAALRYMGAEANYGGRVTDPKDRILINTILEDFYDPKVLNDNHKFSESGIYYCPPEGELSTYKEYIQNELPINDLTEIFGLHDNADITSAINETTRLLGNVLSLMPRVSSGSGKSQEEELQERAKLILDKLPPPFDIVEVARKHPIKKDESMNTVLQQELLRFNKLTNQVKSTLKNLIRAIKGEVVMSQDLEQLGNAMFDNIVPSIWMKVSYPSLKPLGSYINDLIKRVEFMDNWVKNGAPTTFWISGFYFTQSFLTGIKQNHARKYIIPIDQIEFDFEVISNPEKVDTSKKAPDGCYINGLFIEGCRWDSENEVLADSLPKVLFEPMPEIWMIPKKRDEIPKKHCYVCPCYKTIERRGTLSTTGHSTNYVIDLTLQMQEQHDVRFWTKRGVAMVTQLNE